MPLRTWAPREASTTDGQPLIPRCRRRCVTRAHRAALAALLIGTVACARADREPARPPDVEFVPSEVEVVDTMLAMAALTSDDLVYDLGSGDGRILIAAAKRFGARGVGIDIDPVRVDESRHNADTAGVARLVEFREEDFFHTDLRPATVVMLYLLPELNVRLRPRLLAELRPGARVISHEFDMGDWSPDSSSRAVFSRIHMWTIPAAVAGEWRVSATIDSVDREYAMELEQTFQQLSGSVVAVERTAVPRPRADRPLDAPTGRQMPIASTAVRGDSVVLGFFDMAPLRFAGRAHGDSLGGRILRADGTVAGSWRAARIP